MSHAALRFRAVSVRYAPDQAPRLIEASFAVAAGERVALLGLNGSGKTTLLLSTVGLLPHTGEITVDGVRLERATLARIRQRIGFVGSTPADQLLLPTVLDDVALALLRRGVTPLAARTRATAALEALGAAALADLPPTRLSLGQQQRVALAGALVGEPPLLLLDEPSAGLDPPGRQALARLLAAVNSALLVATHDLELAGRLCTRFLWLDQGRIVGDGADLEALSRRWALDVAARAVEREGAATAPLPGTRPGAPPRVSTAMSPAGVGAPEPLGDDAAP